MPPDSLCLLTDDGSATTSQLAKDLTDQGWTVVVLSFPESLVPKCRNLPEGVHHITLSDRSEAELEQKLTEIATTYGSIATWIHLHPHLSQNNEFAQNGNIAFLATDKALMQQIFLLAKHLKMPLNTANGSGRRCFLTVARLDGAFGLSRTIDFSPISAGLFGLTKSLNQEWPDVFCRAIDLSPHLDSAAAAQAILAEIHDPNMSITEVAYGEQGRTTLVCEE